jgi:hypothetical protein
MMRPNLISIVLGCALAGVASASLAATSASSGAIPVSGTVTTFCTVGSLGAQTDVFDMGILTDTATGLLRPDLGPVSKTLNGATCNVESAISVIATPMLSQDFTGVAPTGFSRSVDYTATASGWTSSPATFVTSQTNNPNDTKIQPAAHSGSITVTLSDFTTTGGATLRLVSDPNYMGAITVTLTAQ